MYLKISNDGLIDPRAFSLIGASTKRADNSKIGFFGSGNKYALAYLLRNHITFRVFTGTTEIKFSVEQEIFRNQNFGVIHINGEKTSLSTDMGIKWEPWFIIREIFCNAVDEGHETIEKVEEEMVGPTEGKTNFFIELNKDFETIMNDWDKYFSENRKDCIFFDDKLNQIFEGGTSQTIIYRKGVQCQLYSKSSVFHYNTQWADINESRVLASDHQFSIDLASWLKEVNNTELITKLINTLHQKGRDLFEGGLLWNWNNGTHSDEWLKAIGDRTLVKLESSGFYEEEIKTTPCLILPYALIDSLQGTFGDKIKVMGEYDDEGTAIKNVKTLNPRQEFMLKEADRFFDETKYNVDYPIQVCKFSKSNQLGQAKNKTIYISENVFTKGQRILVETIIEENEHLISGQADETRGFQDHLIQKFISQLEERYAYFL